MSILRYFKPKDSLPDPKESLSANMSSEAIASANGEVREAMAYSLRRLLHAMASSLRRLHSMASSCVKQTVAYRPSLIKHLDTNNRQYHPSQLSAASLNVRFKGSLVHNKPLSSGGLLLVGSASIGCCG